MKQLQCLTTCVSTVIILLGFCSAASGESKQGTHLTPATSQRNGAMPAELYFPERLRGGPAESSSAVQALEVKSEGVLQQLSDKLDDTHSFAGFYAYGKFNHRTNKILGFGGRRPNEYSYGLEWELFRRGYFGYKRKMDEQKVAARVRGLQVKQNMRVRSLKEQIFQLNRLRQTVETFSARSMLDLTSRQLAKARKLLAHGYITRAEYADYVNRQLDAKIRYTSLASSSLVKANPVWFLMLNVAPSLHLASESQLFKQALKISTGLSLQNQFEKRADSFPKWSDHLTVLLYAHRRQLFGTNSENIVGVQARVPLDWKANRSDVVNLEKNSYRLQAEAIRARLKQQIHELSSEFRFQQARIMQLADDYITLDKKIALAEKLASAGLSNLNVTPEKDIELYSIERLSIAENTWLARLDALEKVLSLAAITDPLHPKRMFLAPVVEATATGTEGNQLAEAAVAAGAAAAIREQSQASAYSASEKTHPTIISRHGTSGQQQLVEYAISNGAPDVTPSTAVKIQTRDIGQKTSISSNQSGGWIITLASVSSDKSARQYAARLLGLSVPTQVVRVTEHGRVFYRIRINGFSSRQQAQNKLDAIIRKLDVQGNIERP